LGQLGWRFGPAKIDTRRRKKRISSQLKATPPNIHFKCGAMHCLTERSDPSKWIETVKQNEIYKRKKSICTRFTEMTGVTKQKLSFAHWDQFLQ